MEIHGSKKRGHDIVRDPVLGEKKIAMGGGVEYDVGGKRMGPLHRS